MACVAPDEPARRHPFVREFLAILLLAGVGVGVLIVGGCAPVRPMSAAEQRAREECAQLAAQAGGFDIWDAALRRAEVRQRCIRMKGYEP